MVSKLELDVFVKWRNQGEFRESKRRLKRKKIKSLETLNELVIKSDYKIV